MDDIKNHLLHPMGLPAGSPFGLFFLPVFLGCLGSLFLSVLPLKFIPALNCSVVEYQSTLIETFDEPLITGRNQFLARSGRKSADFLLESYRNPESRSRVISFFTEICHSEHISEVILANSDINDISPALALALAWEESRFNPLAVNTRNRDGSIDRGLFQLNNRSFPRLDVQSFFKPEISAKYGISHLRHCLNTGGTEVAALAMYNAGTGRVRNSGAPKTTLDYVSRILENRQEIERRFMERENLFQEELESAALIAEAKLADSRRERHRLVPLMPLVGMK